MKIYRLPPQISHWIERYIKDLGFNFANPQALAKAILLVSTDYQDSLSVTPWGSREGKAAYISYFFPLNYIRFLKVLDEGKKWGFWNNSQHFIDFGCGPGTLTKALLNDPEIHIPKISGIDQAADTHRYYLDSPRKTTELKFSSEAFVPSPPNSILGASYTLNELTDIPSWFFKFDKLIILEPSTKQAFPKLLQLRDQLLENKYNLIAPCPHSHQCPLQDSKKDWCHDRVHWEQPDWFQRLEKHLPIKNNTLTFSYLLASKQELPITPFGRIVGDAQAEKGKTRWMICQGPEREFLSHLKRQGPPPNIHRGDRIQIQPFEKRGNEIRFELENLKKIE